jgi:hypothetical protein
MALCGQKPNERSYILYYINISFMPYFVKSGSNFFFFFFFFSKVGFSFLAQADPKLATLVPQPPKCWIVDPMPSFSIS